MNEAAWERAIAKRDVIIRRQAEEIAALKQQVARLYSPAPPSKSRLRNFLRGVGKYAKIPRCEPHPFLCQYCNDMIS